MKKIALIGNPVSHSLSPLLFSLAYKAEANPTIVKINGDEYLYEIVESNSVEEAFEKLRRGGYIGANVTAPYKEQIMKYVTHPDAISSAIGVTNLILFKNSQIYSYNTDYLAAYKIVQTILSKSLKNNSFYIIGCGGAGKASALACCNILKENCRSIDIPEVIISNRTLSVATDFVKKIHSETEVDSVVVPLNEVGEFLESDNSKTKIIFYTLPCSIGLKEEIERIAEKNRDAEKLIIIEPNYLNPSFGRKEKNSIVYIGGLEWLIEQAVYGFDILTGTRPCKEKMGSVALLTNKT